MDHHSNTVISTLAVDGWSVYQLRIFDVAL